MPSAESLKSKLKAHARASGADMGGLIKRYGREAVLRRAAEHHRADVFFLKGAMLLAQVDASRATADIDLSARSPTNGVMNGEEGDGARTDLDALTALIREVLAMDGDDGIRFRMDTFVCKHVRASGDGELAGIKVEVAFDFGSARERVLLDVQVAGDWLPDLPAAADYPSLLPGLVTTPRIRMFPFEYVCAEKLAASVEDGGVNTIRTKDAYDLRLLLPRLDGARFADALRTVFTHRLGRLPPAAEIPILNDQYAVANARGYQDWARGKGMRNVPRLDATVAEIRAAIGPLVDGLAAEARPAPDAESSVASKGLLAVPVRPMSL